MFKNISIIQNQFTTRIASTPPLTSHPEKSLIKTNESQKKEDLFEMVKQKEILNSSNNLITLNARGVRYQVLLSQLDKLPNSRLAKLKISIEANLNTEDYCDYYNLQSNEYFYNKDPQILNLILNFYSSKIDECLLKTHCCLNNTSLCVLQLEEEFKYWNIDYDELVEPCCLFRINREKQWLKEELANEQRLLKDLEKKMNLRNVFLQR